MGAFPDERPITDHAGIDKGYSPRGEKMQRLGILIVLWCAVALFGSRLTAGSPAESEAAVKMAVAEGEASTVRTAGIVLKWIRGDKEANLRRARPMIRQAAARGARIVVTTECFLDGYAIADKSIPLATYRALGEPIPEGPCYRRLAALADELDIHLVAGMLEADGQKRFNTAVLIGPDGKLLGKYRKQKLGHELARNTPGDRSSVFQTPYGRLGIMICADRRDEAVVRRFRQHGAEFLICPSGGMFGPEKNDPILQARSRENHLYILFVHPAEFLVTAADGSIAERVLVGDRLVVAPEEAGGPQDRNRVFLFDLPRNPPPPRPAAAR